MDYDDGKPVVLSASTLIGDPVRNPEGEDLGKLEEIMLDLNDSRVSYGVVSFGGVLGMGSKLFAIPWSLLKVDTDQKCVVVEVERGVLESAPGFEKDDWPQITSLEWINNIYTHFNLPAYWE
jgi:sporulation protein YlmC with PRC-barrel domain